MNIDKLGSIVSRIMFAGSALLMIFAVLERIVNFFGFTILPYTPGRLLEIAVMFLVVVITLLLRQVREELKKTNR